MSSIDEVIARSRQKGSFTERQTFTVARQSAIQKMRKFALADPHYYVLELIQSATANGATYIDLSLESSSVRMSYVGGGFTLDELSQLFDFLFASKDNLEIADVRQLALGINALLLAEPDQIVIESGDGTLEGTTRVEIDAANDRVTVGRPEQPLRGTFLSALGINRNRFGAGGKINELGPIENRCLTATIPIIVNDDAIFGHTTQRVPQLFGYPRSIQIDEGDLYGSIGIATTAYSENFKLLTWGVWIESVKFDLLPGHRLGGIVVFDRLRKTADHGSIVQDEVFDEMWARLRPYARQLIGGRTGPATFNIRELDSDERMTASELRARIGEAGGAVSFDEVAVKTDASRRLAAEFGRTLDLPVFITAAADADTIGLLAGEHFVLRPKLTDAELEFYRRDLAVSPPRPWVIGAIELAPFTLRDLRDWLNASGGALANVINETLTRWMKDLGEPTTEVKATVFTPSAGSGAAGVVADVRTAGRTVWRGIVASSFSGHTLVIDLPSASPTRLRENVSGRPLAAYIAEQVAIHATQRLEAATNDALSTLGQRDPEPNSALAHITFGALARGTMKRLRTGADGRQRVVFTVLTDNLDPRALRVPLVRTHSGDPVSCLELEEMLERQHGLVYGTVPEVPADLDGIDGSCVLDLDLATERMLVSLVGEGSYIRIDAREVLAEVDGVQVRDLYLGDAEAPALVTDVRADSGTLSDEREDALVNQLIGVFDGETLAAQRDVELRRQASRHLVWYAANKVGAGEALDERLAKLPLFRTGDGSSASFEELADALTDGSLRMADGWSIDCADLADAGPPQTEFRAVDTIAMNPFVYHALRRVGPLHPTMDYAVGAEVDYDSVEMLVEAPFNDVLGRGRIGIPATPVARPAIGLIDSEEQTVGTIEGIAARYGAVGLVHMTKAGALERDRLASAVQKACQNLITKLANQIDATETNAAQIEHLLRFAGAGVNLTRQPWGSVEFRVTEALSARVLDLAVFPTEHGVAVSAYRFLREFALYGADDGTIPGRAVLAAEAPDYLRRWLDQQLDPARIHSPASGHADPTASARRAFGEVSGGSEGDLIAWLTEMLGKLRPDKLSGPAIEIYLVQPDSSGTIVIPNGWTAKMGAEQMLGYADQKSRRWIYFNQSHPLVSAALAAPGDLARRTWLLLAAYAQINYDYLEVTNDHEIEFQTRVLSLL